MELPSHGRDREVQGEVLPYVGSCHVMVAFHTLSSLPVRIQWEDQVVVLRKGGEKYSHKCVL